MGIVEWVVLAGLLVFIGLIAKRYYDDIVLDHRFRALYGEREPSSRRYSSSG